MSKGTVADLSETVAIRSEASTSSRELRLDIDYKCHGLQAVALENRFLRIVVLPEAGGKVWQITYKPLNSDLLWNNPQTAPARLSAGSDS